MRKQRPVTRSFFATMLSLLLMMLYINHRSAIVAGQVYPALVIAAPLFTPLCAVGLFDPKAALILSSKFDQLPKHSQFLGLVALMIGLCAVVQASWFYLF